MTFTNERNIAVVMGKVVKPLEMSHEHFGEKFYSTTIAAERLSGTVDIIQAIVPEHLIEKFVPDGMISFKGQYRSFNEWINNESHLKLFLYALEIIDIDMPIGKRNEIYLNGFICKEPVYRRTPLGKEITDIFLAVNRLYGKSDYIPCICWGKNAKYAAELHVGDRLAAIGRIQSREYIKVINGNAEKRMAYEVSVNQVLSE